MTNRLSDLLRLLILFTPQTVSKLALHNSAVMLYLFEYADF